ncbi:hypothetical protein E2320_014433 [Naja naja]|nr:hypothetical protein E2320_014433 [Naja naja]
MACVNMIIYFYLYALPLFLISHHVQKCREAVTEYPKGVKDSFRSSQELLFRENFQEDQSQDSMQESRKLTLDFLESPLCAGAEGLAEPLLQVLMVKKKRIARRNAKRSIRKGGIGNL